MSSPESGTSRASPTSPDAPSSSASSASPDEASAAAVSAEGRLVRLWVKRAKRGPMDVVREVQLDARGIVGNANRGGQRQVTIIEAEVWERHMTALGGTLDPARRRANLMVRGCALEGARGRVLRIGACRIAIRGETKPCEQMEEALPGLQAVMFPRWGGGAFGVVLDGGTIREGDVVGWDDAP